ncbi:hypothetical protein [Bartonella sp. TT119HLJHH]|uniref:hypothetical protein n=1 Tax=Bartonella sp. TT119HLJHH TaxID=3243579 RepID=UPI0035CF99EE
MSLVSFENSEIILQGQRVHSLHFRGSTSQHEYQEGVLLISLGEFRFKKTALHVLDGTAIYSNDARGGILILRYQRVLVFLLIG